MSKLLLLVVAAAVIYLLVTGFARKRARSSAPPTGEMMVACAHCGLNLPRSEALEGPDGFYCSEEHRRIGSS